MMLSAWLAGLLAPVLAIATALPPGSISGRPQELDPQDFVYRDGLRLMDNSGPHYMTGLNYWSCMNLASDSSVGGNISRLTTELDQMAAKGVNHLRIMASSEGALTPQPFRMNPPLMDAPGVYNEAIFAGLDRCLDEMSKRGMRATMSLNNFWQWSGGFAQYVSWANDNEAIPYPPSWNLSAPPQRREPNTGWGNYTQIGIDALPYNNFTDYAAAFYENAQAQAWFRDHITAVIQRVNTVNGRAYADDATIMSWQLANEPQPVFYNQNRTGPSPYEIYLPPSPGDPLIPWVAATSAFIKALAPKQLCSAGMESKQGPWYYEEVHAIASVDYGTAHAWVQNWGLYDMLNSSRANLETAKDFARVFVRDTDAWAREVGKPVVLEEFGMARNNWENEGLGYDYLSSAGTSNKDEYFETIIGEVVESFKDPEGAYVGTCPWAYGGVFRPETQHVDEWGMVWAGDPPHESPGWYDVYDTDETMNVIWRQQQDVAAFLQGQQEAGGWGDWTSGRKRRSVGA